MIENVVHFAIFILLCAQFSTSRRYDNYTLLTIHPCTDEQRDYLQHSLQDVNVDVWASSRRHVDILVSPASIAEIFRKLQDAEIAYDVITSDIQRQIKKAADDNAYVSVAATAAVSRSELVFDWLYTIFQSNNNTPTVVGRYARYNEISRWLSRVSRNHPEISSLEYIGMSHERRKMTLIKIGKPCENGTPKPIIWIDAGIHAREWISIAVAISTINTLLSEHDKDENVSEMIEKFDWYILPVANPDGYEYTHTKDRFWRKTRSPQYPCFGVDVNRNFDIDFGGASTSIFKCSEIYMGRQAFSEPETSNMQDVLSKYSDRIQAVISLHSYGQYLFLPFAFNETKPSDYVDLERLANISVQAIEGVNGKKFTFGTPPDLLYAASGSSTDWAKLKLGVKYVFTYELRPEKSTWSTPGFILAEREIAPSAEEFLAALVAMTEHINSTYISV